MRGMNRLSHWLRAAFVLTAALSTFSGMGWLPGYWVFKPSVMVVAIFFVAVDANSTKAGSLFRTFLGGAVVGSLAGDVFLMLSPNLFIPGLASFLVAHLFYIALFRQGQHWFPSKVALAGVLAVGAGMYAVVWSGLGDPVLKGAVAAYVVVIALMAAQALGRATVLGTVAAWRVALGACIFMVSDSTIAINKFVLPVPWSELWILSTYYLAQWLILFHVGSDQAANANRTSPNASANT